MDNVRKRIQSALAAIPVSDFLAATKDLLEVLGYQSDRTQELPGSVDAFIQQLPAHSQNTQTEQAFCENAQSVRLVFQVTSDEIASVNQPMFGFEADSFDKEQQQSFIFFAVELKEATYARGQYAQFTREINKRLSQPTVVLFRTADHQLSLSFVHHREHKRDPGRDVLGHVSLIREINPASPHRAHIDILEDISLERLLQWMYLHGKQPNFDGLLAAWLNTLDTEELNRRFYGELFDWFKRAVEEAKFPSTVPAEQQVIRLITRILFVWFIKEKGLVREEWFVRAEMEELLNDFGGSDYYRVVLQNLFFATLNTEMGARGFSTREEPSHRVFSRFRYQSLIREGETERFEDLMQQTPFINGGLFDCLDDEESKSAGGRRIDMFSDPDENDSPRAAQARREAWRELNVPDALFFDEDHGLFPLLDRYKFTVEENTPIEQEVALDPELLGKVFENLLAAYNPETRETVRRQTGSYYTPRDVVDYMVEEVLVAALAEKAQPDDGDIECWRERLRYLLDYEDAFDDANELFEEVEAKGIVRAIAEIKVLDPAVGSGAFPMGILHKLTLALQRIDPGNKNWEALQKKRATQRAAEAFETPNQQERDAELNEISDTFERYRDSDFGRKLYLIQNSIFGVDIQPVACQIAKLRFFISLAIEQETDETADNFGIKPLPNLETRFVAANTLLSLDKSVQLSLGQTDVVNRLEQELNENRERYFHATTRQQKFDYREKDAELREELAAELKGAGFSPDAAGKIAHWNPYDQNAVADWFDAEYMFGMSSGFDVVIGNPPYISALDFASIYGAEAREELKAIYDTAKGSYDIYVLFIEKGMNLVCPGGVLSYITPNKYLSAKYAVALRDYILKNGSLEHIVDLSSIKIFQETSVYPIISVITKKEKQDNQPIRVLLPKDNSVDKFQTSEFHLVKVRRNLLEMLTEYIWGFLLSNNVELLSEIIEDTEPLEMFGDINATSTASESDEYGKFISNEYRNDSLKIINTGTIGRYTSLWGVREMKHTRRKFLTPYLPLEKASVNMRRRKMYKSPKIIFAKMAKGCEAYIDIDGEYASLNTNCFYNPKEEVSLKFVGGICNSKLFMFLYERFFGALRMSGGYYQFQAPQIRVMPIKRVNLNQQAPVIDLVDQILKIRSTNPTADTSVQEVEIDRLVYELYGLTEEEIATVEGKP